MEGEKEEEEEEEEEDEGKGEERLQSFERPVYGLRSEVALWLHRDLIRLTLLQISAKTINY